jgi:hypothetical protein
LSKSQLENIAQIKAVYGMDYGVEAAHETVEAEE